MKSAIIYYQYNVLINIILKSKGKQMIIKKENAINKQFLGVDFVVLAICKKSMVTKRLYKITDNVPKHSHPNEQN